MRSCDRKPLSTGAVRRPARSGPSLGESIIRLGRRVAGESVTTPAWTG